MKEYMWIQTFYLQTLENEKDQCITQILFISDNEDYISPFGQMGWHLFTKQKLSWFTQWNFKGLKKFEKKD